ncbi:MAG: Asp-tRNA(Asn)/Glu-tRNA(Gln) amidotransferase subunit GatA [Candidatus Brocadiia bacterium]
MSIGSRTGIEIRQLILDKKASAQEVVSELLKHIKSADHKIKAYLTLCEEQALKQAKLIDEKIAAKQPVGALAGIPIAIKDNICTEGVRTTCASKILGNFIPPYDATVIKKIKAADGIIIGKTNLDEFAMGSSCENSAFGPTYNPHNTAYVPGGSSGGSAAAVAASMAPLALGSDTGGSIRQPAALCGVVGLKPTYGSVSRYGLVAFASSLDQIGPIARTTADAELLYSVINGHDPLDSTSAQSKDKPTGGPVDLKNLRIGLPKEFFAEGIQPEIKESVLAAIEAFRKMGAQIKDISLPHTKYGIATYYLIAPSEASSNLARYDGIHYGYRAKEPANLMDLYARSRDEGFGPEVKRRIMLGTFALSSGYYDAYYLQALKVRQLIKQDFDNAWKDVDVIIGPTSPIPAFKVGAKIDDPLQMYLCDIFTVTANLAGIPGISLPCGITRDKLPIGLQILGKEFDEATLFKVASAFEETRDK